MPTVIDALVINSRYEEPSEHWRYDRDRFRFKLEADRRLHRRRRRVDRRSMPHDWGSVE